MKLLENLGDLVYLRFMVTYGCANEYQKLRDLHTTSLLTLIK